MSRPPRHRRLLAELKRRKVLRVAAAYGAGAFVAIEASDLVLPRIGLGEVAVTVVVWLAIAGLPVALALAWFWEWTPEGLRRTEAPGEGEIERIAGASIRQRWPSGVLAVAGVALLVASAWLALGIRDFDGADALEAEPHRVTVLPFTVSGSAEYDYLRSGMVDLLTTRLDGVGPLRTVPARAVMGLARQEGTDDLDHRAAEGIATRLGAGLFVTGRIVESGGRLSLAADLYRAGQTEPVAEARAEGGHQQLFEMVDRLTARLVAGLEDTPEARVRQIAALTTDSLTALKAYLEGEELFRRGRFSEALEAFERATAIDSTFALAHYRVGLAREWGGLPGSQEAAEVAARHADRLSERDRLLVEANLAWRRGEGERAADVYRTILGRWPDDVEAWLELAEVLNHYGPLRGGSISDSREAFESVLRFEPDHLPALWHLARIEFAEGRMAAADSTIERIRSLSPEGDRTLELMAMRAAGSRSAEWDQIMDSLRSAQDMTRWMTVWNVAVYGKDLDRAREAVGVLTDPSRASEARLTGYLLDAFLALARGRPGESDRAMEQVAAIDPGTALAHGAAIALLPFLDAPAEELERHRRAVEAWDPPRGCVSTHPLRDFEPATCIRPLVRLYLLGVLEARLGSPASAEARLVELRGAVSEESRYRAQGVELVAGVQAEIALARSDSAAALRVLESSPGHIHYLDAFSSIFYSHGRARWQRARLLEAHEDFEEAVRWYDSFDELSAYDLVFQGPAQLRAGRILERLGRREEASVRYRRTAAILDGGEGRFVDWAREAQGALERLGAPGASSSPQGAGDSTTGGLPVLDGSEELRAHPGPGT